MQQVNIFFPLYISLNKLLNCFYLYVSQNLNPTSVPNAEHTPDNINTPA